MLEIKIREVSDGYIYEIVGLYKQGGERVAKKTEEYHMLERIGEAILGHKIKVERK